MRTSLYFWILLLLYSCLPADEDLNEVLVLDPSTCSNSIIERELFYQAQDHQFLWADEDSAKHFDITNWSLNACNLRHGLGREHFKALIRPGFEQLSQVIDNYREGEKAVMIRDGSTAKVYPLSTLVVHEAVNDVVNGAPILVVNCFLAELVTVYSRNYCGQTLTFGVSGYTYADRSIADGLESFILWDRNSESLWWPIIDRGISGYFKEFGMTKYANTNWEVMDLRDVLALHPNARVLKRGQTFIPPKFPNFPGCP